MAQSYYTLAQKLWPKYLANTGAKPELVDSILPVKTNVLIGTVPINITIGLSNPLPGISTVKSINQSIKHPVYQNHNLNFIYLQ